ERGRWLSWDEVRPRELRLERRLGASRMANASFVGRGRLGALHARRPCSRLAGCDRDTRWTRGAIGQAIQGLKATREDAARRVSGDAPSSLTRILIPRHHSPAQTE